MNIEMLLLDNFLGLSCFWLWMLASLGAFLLGWLLNWLLSTKWRNRAAELEADLAKLQAKYADLEKDHVSLKYQHDELEKDITALRASLNKCESDKAVLITKLEQATGDDDDSGDDGGSYGTGTGTVDGDHYSTVFKPHELQIIEGIGPKIESLLKDGGINNWHDLATADQDKLRGILDAAGPRYRIHDPKTWPKQAELARDGKWDELVEYQKFTDGGRDDKGDGSSPSKVEKLLVKRLGFSTNPEDLKIVEGIGPKIEGLLKDAGINNWSDLAAANLDKLKEILANAGERYRLADPSTWAKQAELAAAGKWRELTEYQDFLQGGKDPSK